MNHTFARTQLFFTKFSWKVVLLTLVMSFAMLFSPLKDIIVPEFVVLHTILEFLCISVSLMIFIVQYVLRTHNVIERYQALGIPFLGVGILDLLHTLSYRDMPNFITSNSAQKSISFWFAARLLEALCISIFSLALTANYRFKISSRTSYFLIGLFVSLSTLVIIFQPDLLPEFANDSGQISNLKIGIEYFLIAIHILIVWFLFRVDEPSDQRMKDLISASMILAISGLSFSSFADGHDLIIFVGHVLKTLAYYYILRSCILDELLIPYSKVKEISEALAQRSASMQAMQSQLARTERMSAVGQSLTAVIHDLNNMFSITEAATIRLMKSLSSQESEDSIRKYADMILRSLAKTKTFQKMILEKSRVDSNTKIELVDLGPVVQNFIPFLEAVSGVNNTVEFKSEPNLLVHLSLFELEQILVNFVVNARDAMKVQSGGKICIEMKKIFDKGGLETIQGKLPQGPYVVISVADSGPGITEEVLPKIFDPFFTTKDRSEGTGIGLANVKEIVESWQGFISVETKLNFGTTFKLFFPTT